MLAQADYIPPAFHSWLATAKRGERFEYHRGHLVIDRYRGATRLSEGERFALSRLQEQVQAAHEADRVALVQRRNGKDDYSYLAVALSPRRAQ